MSTDSLKDSIAKNADLKSQLANAKRNIDYLESKMKGKDADLKSLTEALRILKESLENKNNSNPKETESKRNENLKNKVAGLEKKLAETTEDNNRLREAAENSQSAAQGLRITLNELLSQLSNLKKMTLCLDDNCTSEKECGASHSRKEENRGPCKYFISSKCNKENECTFKHDAAARKLHHDQVKMKKEEEEKKRGRKRKKRKKGRRRKRRRKQRSRKTNRSSKERGRES